MKSDSLGLTRILNDTHRICNYCGIEYKLSTSSYTIFKHCAKHAPFHSILIRHLGNHSFQNYLSMVPPDYVDPPPIDPDFESKLAKKNGFVNGEKKKEPSPGILDSRSLCDILKFGDGKTSEQSVTPTLTNLSNLFNTLDEVSKVNMSEEKNGSLKIGDSSSDEKIKEDNETVIDDPLHDPMVEEIMKNPEQLPSGFRKRLKTDNLKLTKLVSVKHRICLACNRRFMSSCGVTSLYKHCAKHPEFREILRKNLTPSALENAMRGAKVLPNNTNMTNYSRKDVSSKVDENSTNNSFGSFNVDNLFSSFFNSSTSSTNQGNETIKSNDNSFFELLRNNLSSNQQLDGDIVPPPCKRPKSADGDRSTDSPLLLQDDTVKAKTPDNEDLSSLCIQFSEEKNFPIERFDSLEFQNLLKYGRDIKDVPQINSDLIYQLKSKEFIEEMSNKINWDGNFGKISLSVDEIALNSQKTIASIIVHYMDNEYKTNSVTVGFVVVKNEGNRRSIECVLQEIEKILEKYNITKSNIVAILSDKSLTSKKVIENWGISEIVCLRREIESIIDFYDDTISITLKTLFFKAISLFSIYNSIYSSFPVTTDFFKLPKGKVFTFSSHWTYTCYIFLESIEKINDINDFASKYCPFLLLTSDEILSLQLLNYILRIFANFCTRFFDEGRGLYYYIPIVQDLYDDINKLNLDDPISSIKTDRTYKSPKCLLKAPSTTYLWFDVPDEKVSTSITKKNCITIVKEFHQVIKEKLTGLKNKVYGDKLLLKALYLNSVEVFRIKYGKEEFWDELGNSLDPETESVPENQGRVSFGQSTKTKGQKYNIFVTENESYTVEEFWKLHKSSFKKLHEYVKTIFCIPAYGLSLEKYKDILSDNNDNCVDENYSTILAYKISRISN